MLTYLGAQLARVVAGAVGEAALAARRLLGGAGGGEVARRGVGALARVGEVGGARVAASLARQRRRRANSAVASRLARLARRLAFLVLVRAAGAGQGRRIPRRTYCEGLDS